MYCRLDGLFGVRQLEDDDSWDPLDEQGYLGVELAIGPPTAFVQGQFGLHYGFDDGTLPDGMGDHVHLHHYTWELTAGVVKVVRVPGTMLRPYLGAGVSLLYEDAALWTGTERFHDDDFGFGLYARAGLLVEFALGRYAGIDVRRLMETDTDISGLTEDADATYVSVVLGYSF